MPAIKDAANEALARGRDAASRAGDTASRVGKVARSAAVKAAKAGAAAAVMAGSTELKKGWSESNPALAKQKSRRRKIAAVVAGAAALAAVGVAVSRNKSAAKKALNEIVEDAKSLPQPKDVAFLEWVDFWARLQQIERELKVEAKGLIADRLKAIETKLRIKADPNEDFYPRGKNAIKKYLRILSSHYPAHVEGGDDQPRKMTHIDE